MDSTPNKLYNNMLLMPFLNIIKPTTSTIEVINKKRGNNFKASDVFF